MQIAERIFKYRVPLIAIAVAIIMVFALGRLRGRGPGTANTVNRSTLALASAEDSAVYSAARDFVHALVSGEREQVLAMLTDSHRQNWTENSFLYGDGVREKYDTIEVRDIRCGIVRYVQIPELGNGTTALVTVIYIVEFRNNGTVEAAVKMQENLGLQKAGDQWLIAADERKQAEQL